MMEITLYIACSLDGYIAGPNNDLSFLDAMQIEGEDYGYGAFYQDIDAVISGRKTLEWVQSQGIERPHPEKDHYILSSQLKNNEGGLYYYNGSVSKLVERLKAKGYSKVFLEGGAEIIHQFLKAELIDRLQLFIVPTIVGEGIKLFTSGQESYNLELETSKHYPSGMVEMLYRFTRKL
jgi:dihydrofolate reductase